MKVPIEDTTLLRDNRGHIPIMAPHGHQVTLGEFTRVTGKGKVVYATQGTNISIDLEDLIAKAFIHCGFLYSKDLAFMEILSI